MNTEITERNESGETLVGRAVVNLDAESADDNCQQDQSHRSHCRKRLHRNFGNQAVAELNTQAANRVFADDALDFAEEVHAEAEEVGRRNSTGHNNNPCMMTS